MKTRIVLIGASAATALFLASTPASAIEDELVAAIEIEAIQPPPDLIEQIEEQPSLEEEGVERLGDFPKEDYPYQPRSAIVKDHLPFYPYYALREGSQHVLHPMALGRFLLRNAEGALADESVEAALSVAYELPNGGLAWYYPRHYQVARMLGENLKYSSISQGTILAGLTGMAEAGVTDMTLAEKAYKAMLWPFEKGGVNLADRAVLEMPSFSGPPEIILNGWIDALLHIRDYGEISGNDEAIDFFARNVSFLAEILPEFDSREAGLSRYSDVSPYRVKIRLTSPEDFDSLNVLYRPVFEGLPAIKVDLAPVDDPDDFSVYENQILRQNGREAFVWISCSQLYETVLASSSEEMSVELSRGTIDRRSTTPGFSGRTMTLESEPSGDYRIVEISEEDGLICGYPTNFSKGGTHNYYHVYHVVGLMLIAMSEHIADENRRTLLEWAVEWKADVERIEKEEGLAFRSFEDMLSDINANQAEVGYTDFSELMSDAQAILAE